MSADVLRRAASLIRERAEAATGGRWFGVTGPGGYPNEVRTGDGPDSGLPVLFGSKHLVGTAHYMRGEDAHHAASWHPAVALTVADLLDESADWMSRFGDIDDAALRVARAYLGESA